MKRGGVSWVILKKLICMQICDGRIYKVLLSIDLELEFQHQTFVDFK